MADADLKKKVESILFAAGRAVLLKELQSLLHINEPGLIKETVRELKDEYESKDSPIMVLSEGEGWKLTVREGFLPLVRKINPHTELSKTILETLAVIAWKQPALQSDVIKIRTNKAYDHIAELERLGFITKERHGRSFLVRVTQKFLDYFDLPDDKSIKEVFKDFKDIEVAVQRKAAKMEKEKGKPDEKSEEVPEEKVELESYVDVLPEMKKPKKGTELEVYDVPPEEAEKEQETEEAEPEKSEEEEEKREEQETPEEKARRIAREMIGEEPPKMPEIKKEEPAKSKLHPELEEFIAEAEEKPPAEGSEPGSEPGSGTEPGEEAEDTEKESEE